MRDCDRRIRCGISESALEVIDPKFERSKEGRLVAFNKHRAHIESVASAKYDGGEIERDGRTILVNAADLEGHLSDASGNTASATAAPQAMRQTVTSPSRTF
jgi:hypothetical protein